MRRLGRVMEVFWIVVMIITGVLAGYVIATVGWEQGRQWLWFPPIAAGMWLFRRFMRRKLDAMEQQRAQRERP